MRASKKRKKRKCVVRIVSGGPGILVRGHNRSRPDRGHGGHHARR